MRGYEVVTSDNRGVGRVVDLADGFLVVESGRLFRSRRPIPREFAHAVDESRTVFVTVPRRVLEDAPRVDRRGRFDLDDAARHFGLARSYFDPGHAELERWSAARAGGIEHDVIVAAAATIRPE